MDKHYRKYDLAMLSNVLNTQVSLSMLYATLSDVLMACKHSTTIICNYPHHPRFLVDDNGKQVTINQLKAILEQTFGRKLKAIRLPNHKCLWVL